MKMKKLAIYTLMVALFGGVSSCENPLKDFNLQISTEVIENYVTLRVVDADGANVSGVSVSLVSGDTQDIYNMNGYKDFKLTDNLLVLGVDPARTPTANSPIRFRVQFSAPGYTTQTVPVAITDASAGIQTVVLTKPTEVPDGAEEVVENVDLNPDGSTAAETTIDLPSATGTGDMTLTIPSGTQFKDANGTVITGTNVQIVVTSIDADNEDAVVLLPEGSLRAEQVVLEGGATASGTFSPAAVADIKMLVNGTQVRQFSHPLVVSMPVPANYVSPITGQPLAAGMVFQIFSNSGDGVWRYEQTSAVTGSAATGYRVPFEIDHLTFYMAAEFGQACPAARLVSFSGDWMTNGTTAAIKVDAVWGGKVVYTGDYSITRGDSIIALMNLPVSGVKLVIRKGDGNILAESDLAACGQTTAIQLPDPSDATSTTSTLQLYVRCPGQANVITLLPTFQMFYREVGTTEFKYLGSVSNGYLRTTLLKTDGTKYDFKAIWNERVKIVNDHAVTEDNSATVGTAPGDILGDHAAMTNLAILSQECDNL
ncbi:hypothetical protein H8B06_02765 [Sphingobacterium sp. DN00404]|uniref:Uncharacterized protein n=1 Tax=Sphingobacterium micropteri TaxID=2763501 RepID=A0ABR7YKE8_9SPHI|nr:hypothetical protein [Sphingobacterium micropteri]MBD1431734.1 hypothetical protein [Sphingobacterium micropteri]